MKMSVDVWHLAGLYELVDLTLSSYPSYLPSICVALIICQSILSYYKDPGACHILRASLDVSTLLDVWLRPLLKTVSHLFGWSPESFRHVLAWIAQA